MSAHTQGHVPCFPAHRGDIRKGSEAMLNKQKGNMYEFCTFTWNPIKGRCYHACKYCYAKRTHGKPPYLDEKCFKDNLGSGNKIFVGSSTDMWGSWISGDWIERVLEYCRKYPDNEYLFQTKNPIRYKLFEKFYPTNTTLCCTIESNLHYGISYAPAVHSRCRDMLELTDMNGNFKTAITIEPIMYLDVHVMQRWIANIAPAWVAIGADSGHHHLPEPPAEKIKELIAELQGITEVRIKPNLYRLLPEKEAKR